ncbi:DUF1501 domain-containing protein [Telmatocola sphagniphila]|uniref:DUF1501 domain-containing protein n=1 Tax=Telmatocola sphagniphila TaxID=1123043 RepID=A0A8E6EW83_9BACT|nr:DUF1501 domain-containing protein [Telmatocola sphagniphila]QVL33532.1 DUF1501 domain-containing protein [Telmatocola sphagniphila]
MLHIQHNRRQFLRVGALAPLSFGLTDFLKLQSVASDKSAKAKSVILIYLGGGLSHHDSFDLKPEAPEEIRGKYKPIATSVKGLQIAESLPKTAQIMNKVTLIRSASHNNDHHETATNWALSGRFGSPFGDYPAIGAVVAKESGFTKTLPPYVSIPRNPSFTWELGKSAFLGGRYESFRAGDPNEKNYKVRDVSPSEEVGIKKQERRAKLLETVDNLARTVQGNDQIATYDEFRKRASDMILSSEARKSFAIEQESEKTRDRFGRTTFGQSCLLARRLIEGGVKFITINFGGWDHHAKIFEGLDKKLPEFDSSYSALIEDLDSRGLLKDTLVACFGEFGRSPKINKDTGRDHWGQAASILFAGAGVGRGQVIGATDKQGGYPITQPIPPADVCYTILSSLGIDPRKIIHTPDGRPIEILDQGEMIKGLFA